MSKQFLQSAIEDCVAKGNGVFIPYIMAGDGGLNHLSDQLTLLQKAGATAVELGIPFSDPVADGPTIQEAGKRALAHGVTLRNVMQEVKRIRKDIQIPIILMTYLNPVYQYGIEQFASDCQTTGVSGVIVPDLPLEECALLKTDFEKNQIALIQIVSLTSPMERIKRIAEASEGFLYAVTVNGITGARNSFEVNIQDHIASLKHLCTVPVMAGFGISTPSQVREMCGYADGVIVGSRIVDALKDGDHQFINELIGAAKNVTTHEKDLVELQK